MNVPPARQAEPGIPLARRPPCAPAPERPAAAGLFDPLEDGPDRLEGVDAPHPDDPDGPEGPWGVDPPGTPARSAAPTRPPADDGRLAAWIAQVAERDERALSALYDATLSRVYGLVLRIVRRPAWAEEVVEDTYFQVWRQAPRFDPERGRALTWLLGMARSRAIDALRREARHQHPSIDGDGDEDLAIEDTAQVPAADWVQAVRGQDQLHHALLGLGAQPRQLVALAFFRGLSHEEIAEQMALPLGTVKSQIRRALLTLREVLGTLASPAWPG